MDGAAFSHVPSLRHRAATALSRREIPGVAETGCGAGGRRKGTHPQRTARGQAVVRRHGYYGERERVRVVPGKEEGVKNFQRDTKSRPTVATTKVHVN